MSRVYLNISSVWLCRTSTTLIAFFSLLFFTDDFQLLYLDEFCTYKARKDVRILRGTSFITYPTKRCFYFSNFRYGFPVRITYYHPPPYIYRLWRSDKLHKPCTTTVKLHFPYLVYSCWGKIRHDFSSSGKIVWCKPLDLIILVEIDGAILSHGKIA